MDLSALNGVGNHLEIGMKWAASGARLGCLGLTAEKRLVSDCYFVFEHQVMSSCNSCGMIEERLGGIRFDLSKAPAAIQRFLIITYTDAIRGLGAHGDGALIVRNQAVPVAECSVKAEIFGAAACAQVAEIYRRGTGWRLGILLENVAVSLEMFLRAHGADVRV